MHYPFLFLQMNDVWNPTVYVPGEVGMGGS